MINKIYKNAETRMEKCIDMFNNQINKIRTNRASSNLLEDVKIEYYGAFVSLKKLASIVVEDFYTIIINPFDKKLLSVIEKAIINSNLGINVSSFGTVIRIILPRLTEERRKNLIKIVRSYSEQSKISIRKVRHDVNNQIKILLKNKIISKDEDHSHHNKLQKLTDIYIEKINSILYKKEIELIEI